MYLAHLLARYNAPIPMTGLILEVGDNQINVLVPDLDVKYKLQRRDLGNNVQFSLNDDLGALWIRWPAQQDRTKSAAKAPVAAAGADAGVV